MVVNMKNRHQIKYLCEKNKKGALELKFLFQENASHAPDLTSLYSVYKMSVKVLEISTISPQAYCRATAKANIISH